MQYLGAQRRSHRSSAASRRRRAVLSPPSLPTLHDDDVRAPG
jgi:hypothetical protein